MSDPQIPDRCALDPIQLAEAGDPVSTLRLTSTPGTGYDDAFVDLLEIAPPPELNVLYVTLTTSAEDCIRHWRTNVALSLPENLGVVSVDDSGSGAESAGLRTEPAPGSNARAVSSVEDLTGIGLAVSEFLTEWDGNGATTVVGFDSVTTLLQYADAERVFQFLHVLLRRFESMGVVAYFELTPSAHDDQTVRTVSSLFEHVIDETADSLA